MASISLTSTEALLFDPSITETGAIVQENVVGVYDAFESAFYEATPNSLPSRIDLGKHHSFLLPDFWDSCRCRAI